MNAKQYLFTLFIIVCFASCIIQPTMLSIPVAMGLAVEQGLASLPYSGTDLEKIESELIKTNASVTLEDVYLAAYGRLLSDVMPDGDTGQAFTTMKEATSYFQRVLTEIGLADVENYIFTSIDTANEEGYTLFAVVYRPSDTITVTDKYDGKTERTLTAEDKFYYEPFKNDRDQEPLDEILDWAGIPTYAYATQKQQALMLTLAANKVLDGKLREDYWNAEQEWIAGNFGTICKSQDENVCDVLGLKRGFMDQ